MVSGSGGGASRASKTPARAPRLGVGVTARAGAGAGAGAGAPRKAAHGSGDGDAGAEGGDSVVSAEGSSWFSGLKSGLTSLTDLVTGSAEEGPTGSSASGGGSAAPPSACKGGRVGDALSMREAVERYVSLPWTMRRKGGTTTPLQTFTDSNVTCFTTPYAAGGPLDKPCASFSAGAGCCCVRARARAPRV